MDVLMGLLAAALWGATDFLVGMNARAVGVRRAVFFGQLLGLLLMGLIIAGSSQQLTKMVAAPTSVLLFACMAALCTLSGALALSKAFAIGQTSVVATLVTSYGVFTTLLAWLGGEVLGTWQIFGLLTCFLGVVLASREAKGGTGQAPAGSRLSVGFALLAALLYGISFWVQGKYVLPVLGPVNMLALGYGVGVLFLLPAALRMFRGQITVRLKTWGTLCGASLFNLGGFSAFSWGALHGSIAVVTVISTLSGGIAAILGFLFYRERLSADLAQDTYVRLLQAREAPQLIEPQLQVVGVALVLAGAVLLHLYK